MNYMTLLGAVSEAAQGTLGDRLVEGLFVTIMGVALVFLILAFLILVTYLLKLFNIPMDRWDAYMVRFRAKKHEIKKLKTTAKDEKSHKIDALDRNLSAEDRAREIEKINAEYVAVTQANAKKIEEISAVFEKINSVEKERRAAIAKAKADNKISIKNAVRDIKAKSGDAQQEIIAKKVLLANELTNKINDINAEFDAKTADINGTGIDEEIIAVITAVIAAVTAEEANARGVKFNITSIKKN